MTVTTIDTSAAERRALKIGLRLDAIVDNYERVMPMIREALELGDHETLGYRSPGDYLADRYGKALSRLPMAVRREAIAAIDSVHTVSTRSLVPVFDVDQKTISNDRRAIAAGEETSSPDPAPSPDEVPEVNLANVDKTTGEIHETPAEAVGAADDAVQAEPEERVESTPAPRPPVTGLDGKTYPRPELVKPRRSPLPDAFFKAAYDLRKVTERLQRLVEDDRFPTNREQVALRHENDLLQTAEALAGVLRALHNNH